MWNKIRDNKHRIVELTHDIEDFTNRISILGTERRKAQEKMIEFKDNKLCVDAYKRVETVAIAAINTLKIIKEKMENRLSTLL